MKLVERGGGSRKRGGLCAHFLSVGVAFWQQPNGNAKKSTVAAGGKNNYKKVTRNNLQQKLCVAK